MIFVVLAYHVAGKNNTYEVGLIQDLGENKAKTKQDYIHV